VVADSFGASAAGAGCEIVSFGVVLSADGESLGETEVGAIISGAGVATWEDVLALFHEFHCTYPMPAVTIKTAAMAYFQPRLGATSNSLKLLNLCSLTHCASFVERAISGSVVLGAVKFGTVKFAVATGGAGWSVPPQRLQNLWPVGF
jgi:hypothetical protein